MSRRINWVATSIAALLVLLIVTGLGNLWATYSSYHHFQDQYNAQQAENKRQDQTQKASQKAQDIAVQKKICTTLSALAALKPPPGDAKKNPSRAYDQQLHDVLAGLGPDIGCPNHN